MICRFIQSVLICCLIACGVGAEPAAPAAAATRPATRPGRGAPGDSGVSIAVTSMKVDYLMFRRPKADGTIEEVASDKPVLLVSIEIQNKGAEPVRYQSANGVPGSNDAVAALRDDRNQLHAVVQFEATLERTVGVRQATLKPGESVIDVLAFIPPPEGVKPRVLLLPASCHGNVGTWSLPLSP